jgi:hypothetical protein
MAAGRTSAGVFGRALEGREPVPMTQWTQPGGLSPPGKQEGARAPVPRTPGCTRSTGRVRSSPAS